ncbi:MAG TPA: EAL domain-containing protein, partial [Euzebya sp.]|nr:EAL domain-containing protein [Euzebya sp.]
IVRRGSCGCGTHEVDPADTGARLRPGMALSGEGSAVPAGTADRITRLLLTGGDTADQEIRARARDVVAQVDALMAADPDITPGRLDALTEAVRGLASRPAVLRHIARALNDHVQGAADPPTSISRALWHLEAASFLTQSTRFERRLDEQVGIDGGLLDAGGTDPRDLSWLQGTHVVGGVLGLWDAAPGSGPLRLVGVHDPSGTMADLLGTSMPVEHFPPAPLVALARADLRQICYVVPVRTSTHDWGLLALVAEIETTSSHETYHHWAAMLATVLDQRALQEAVQASEERYAFAALAARDGLWEWDAGSAEIYVSDRCRELLAMTGEEPLRLDTWTRRVVADDVQPLQEAMARARAGAGMPVEVEFRVQSADGTRRWVLSRCVGVGPLGTPVQRLVGSLSDIQTRKELEHQLRQGALYDDITGLPNRRLFLERLTSAVEMQRRRPDARFAVIFLDLDSFKLINDSLGHLLGDELLRVIAERLRSDLRTADTAARFGGDEFAVLLSEPMSEEVLGIAQRIQDRLSEPIYLGGHEITVTASIGIATSETRYHDPEDVLRDADIAMYHAKAAEPGSASVFDPDMHARASGRLRQRGEIRAALAERQFVVHYQPIVALDGSPLAHFEALIRWEHPERGLLMPGDFLPAMQDDATIVALGQWVIDEVCRQVAEWHLSHHGPIAVSVNLSHREFWSEALLLHLDRALARHQVSPHSLVLEITESVIMDDLDDALQVMASLRGRGVRLHVDDFGTGQSSLHALRTFPVDALKIDGSFIRELGVVAQTTELVRIILEMGRVLGLEVVAECVETVQQADQLRGMGCQDAQGWLYAKALPGDDAGRLLGTCMSHVPTHTTVSLPR